MCVPTLCVLYVGVAMAGVGSTTLAEYGESTTLVVAAQNLFPTVLFYFFIIGGPSWRCCPPSTPALPIIPSP